MANPTPWKTNDWFVSEWNYAPEVTKDFKFAKNIKIHDVTLRDGEQQTGVILSKDEKIRIAEVFIQFTQITWLSPLTGKTSGVFVLYCVCNGGSLAVIEVT